MPITTIREEDLSTTGEIQTNSVVYVPGYAITGPVNEPTLCKTKDEFERIFGAVPYVIKSAQSYNTLVNFYKPGDKERSWIYAHELLNSGCQVMFERILSTDALDVNASVSDVELAISTYAANPIQSSMTFSTPAIITQGTGFELTSAILNDAMFGILDDTKVNTVTINTPMGLTYTLDVSNL